MRVEVYRNLTKDTLSIREAHGKVLHHTDACFIRNPEFVVQPAGRNRVLEERVKNVHAFVRGELVGYQTTPNQMPVFLDYLNWRDATYNPFKYDSFVDRETELSIQGADWAVVQLAQSGRTHIFYKDEE